MAIDTEILRKRLAAALPRKVRWFIHGTPLDFNFSRVEAPLVQVREAELSGELEPAWQSLVLFGEQDFAEGGGATPFLGIHVVTGQVSGLDVEREDPVYPINSDIESYIKTFLLLDGALRKGSPSLAAVATQAQAIDPTTYPRSDWSQLIQYLLKGD